jgi:hypothetical protein
MPEIDVSLTNILKQGTEITLESFKNPKINQDIILDDSANVKDSAEIGVTFEKTDKNSVNLELEAMAQPKTT